MKRVLAVAAVAYAGLMMFGGAFLADRVLHRPRAAITGADRVRADALAQEVGGRLDTVSISGQDGAALRGWLLTPRHTNSHSVLLLHSIVSNRGGMLVAARPFLEEGYRALLVDLRANGDSEGSISTFGVNDVDDIRRWIAWIRRDVPGTCVYQVGQSLGAAVALQAADVPGLCAVIADSGFASLRELAFDRVGQQLNAGSWVGRTIMRPGIELGFAYARMRYGIDLGRASALPSVGRPGVPILVIHGMSDDNVPPRHARLIVAANPERVTMWLVPGAAHGAGRHAAPDEYRRRTMDFLARHRTLYDPAQVLSEQRSSRR